MSNAAKLVPKHDEAAPSTTDVSNIVVSDEDEEMRRNCRGGKAAGTEYLTSISLHLKCTMWEVKMTASIKLAMSQALKEGVDASNKLRFGWYAITPAQQAALAVLPPMQRQSNAVVSCQHCRLASITCILVTHIRISNLLHRQIITSMLE